MFDLVLLDTGFSSSYRGTNHNVNIAQFTFKNKKWVEVKNHQDEVGHGTSVLLPIIRRFEKDYPESSFSILIFNIFSKKRSEDSLFVIKEALRYIYKNIDAKFIQASLGVCGYDFELESLCYDLYKKKKMIIVSALDNSGCISFPAGFDFVIGVKGNKFLSENEFIVRSSNVVDIEARAFLNSVLKNEKYTVEIGNSFATSFVTTKLIIEWKLNKKTIDTKLHAKRLLDNKFKPKKIFSYKNIQNLIKGKRISIFPVNKENQSVINYSDMLSCKLNTIYDVKYNGRIGEKIKSFSGTTFTIQNIKNIDYDSFDVLIIGHVSDLSKLLKKDIKKELIDYCLKNHKSVYCYDSEGIDNSVRLRFRKEKLDIICADDIEYEDNFGFLYQFKTPIVSVIGTSKQQGKFTLQMQIKKVFEKNNLKVGLFGTEPNSVLFGASSMCSYGYHSKYKEYPERKLLELINQQMFVSDKGNYDLIVTGMQSKFLPSKYRDLINSTFSQANQFPYIYGVTPDCLILCVNIYDNFIYIKNTIKVIEILLDAKVIMLALNPFIYNENHILYSIKEKVSKKQFNEFKDKIKKFVNLPIIISGDNSFDGILFNTISSFFQT